ncbi:hypothetical protein ACFX4N_23695 [Priestia sp. YIM B13551]|uniref:hypothetical protein n=1 Tax=Priestia sp. YIM B13551 TaxID=3366306 RepID=UPI00366D648E
MDEIKRVPLKNRELTPVYITADGSGAISGLNKQEKDQAVKRQEALAQTYNSLLEGNRIKSIGVWESARTPNSFNVNAQQALDPFMKLKAKENIHFFDIEAIGTPEHLRTTKGLDLFAITELSFGGTQFTGDQFARNKGQIVSMAVAPGKHEYERLKTQINQLKRNPMMAVSQDMHRTLLDLAKYADADKFKSATLNGKAYTSLIGHARTPAAGTALTRNTVKEIEAGLNNLFNKGTKLEDALSIFQHDLKTNNAKLGGYNIHHYDLPAILGSIKNKDMKDFFTSASKTSLDFYHGYSATAKDPYSLTGASLRQEHIHQALLGKKAIKTGKEVPKGQLPTFLYHLAADDIQANIDIAGFTYNQINSFIEDAKKSPAEYALTPTSLKTSILEQGQELFSFQSGFFDKEKHKYNLVGTAQKDGKIEPRWSNLNTSLPANESFTIGEFLHKVPLPGTDKQGYGVRLNSKDIDGKSILLMSETQEELAQQIHSSFIKIDKGDTITQQLRKVKVEHDSAFREYERMFDSNGWSKMKEFYRHLNSANEQAKDFNWTKHVTDYGGTEELAIKFPHMVERLKAEKPVWDSVSEQLIQSRLDDNQKSIALRHIKGKFDELGDNKAKVTAEGNKFFNFEFTKGDETLFNAKNTEQIKNSFRGYIRGSKRGDRVGDPEKSYKIARIEELGKSVIRNFSFDKESDETKKVHSIVEGMKREVYAGNKVETALTSMANLVRDHVELKGRSSFTREITNGITPARSKAIDKMKEILPDVVDDSVKHAQSYSKAKEAISSNPQLKQFLQEQDKYIKELFDKNFSAHGMNNTENIEAASNMAAKYESLVGKIMSAYSNDFNTQIRFMDGGNPLLVLADKKSGIDINQIKTYEELVSNARVAAIELPHFDEDHKVRYGNNRKAAVIRSGVSSKKGAYHSTTVTDALNMILDYAGKAKEINELAEGQGKRNQFVQIRQGLRYRVGKQVDPVPTDANRKLNYDDKEMFELKNAIGGEIRSSKWDLTGYSEAWYRENHKRLGLYTTADAIADTAKEKGVSFFEAMGNRAQGYAISGGLSEYASNMPGGLKGSMFGINNRSASKGYLGTARTDARTYMALGNFYSDAVENPHKTVNYRAVDKDNAEKVLSKAGKNQSYRTKNSFISSAAFDVLEKANEVRGLTLQTGYMTDEEIALKLKDKEKIAEYKTLIDKAQRKNEISPKEARQMKKALDMGMLSTSEGLAFMDNKLMKAFDGMDEVRINMIADNVKFNNTIEKAIDEQAEKQGLENGAWKEKGITFDKPLSINVSDMMNDKNVLTLGKYWNKGIESTIEDDKRFRKGDKVHILGFNADDISSRSLVLGRERKTGHGFKAVTEGGFRATMTPMLGEIMSDLYGVDGIEQVISHLGEKKGATDLPALIRGYDTQIRQQFSGTATKKINNFNSEEEALSAFYQDVEHMVGIKTTNKNGQRTVASDFGLDGQTKLAKEGREKLSEKWKAELGLDREVFADITMSHDVWDRQGGKDRGKITVKEIDMLDRSYTRSGFYAPGQTSAHAQFMRDTVFGSETAPEIKAQQKVFKEMVNAIGNYENGWTPKTGDAVIDYTSDGMGVMTDVNAQMKDGVLHVSKDSFQPIPEKVGHNQTFTVGDYNKTIINAGAAEVNLEAGGKGEKLQKYLMENKGTAYLKLPEFAANQYIPLLDTDSMKLPGDVNFKEKTEFLDTLKGHYASIARKTEEYNNLFVTDKLDVEQVANRRNGLEKEINREVSNLVKTLGDSTSKEGMARIMSRRLEMSSQYQFGGVNPVLAYEKKGDKWANNGIAKEGEIYMNSKDVRNLIGDKAENIATSWGVDPADIDTKELGLKQGKKESDEAFRKRATTDWVMKNWNDNDTFSTTIRYPSIDVGTTQALKVKIDDAVGEGQVVGLRGMAERISGDFDGDNLAVFLSHYGVDDDKRRSAILNDISKLHEFDKAKNELAADVIMNDVEKGFRQNLAKASNLTEDHEDVISASKRFFSGEDDITKKLTLGNMHGTEAQEALREAVKSDGMYASWGTNKNGIGELANAEHEKSILARATSTTIGSVDNTRMRMSAAFMTMAETKYKLFNQAEDATKYTKQDYVRETAMVDEFLREYSQKSISAKKVEGSTATAEDVMSDLYGMIDKINNPSNKLDYDTAAADLVDRGLFKNKPFLEIGKGEVYQGSNLEFVKKSLSILGEAEETYSEMGMKGYRESSLLVAASQGIGFHNFSNMVKTGEHIPGGDAVGEISKIAKEYGNEQMARHQEFFEKTVQRVHERRTANINGRLEDASSSLEIMNSNQPVEPKILGNNAIPMHRTIRDQIDDSFEELATTAKHTFGKSAASMGMVGALSFGALWATNALMKKAPEPEGLQEMAPVNPEVLGAPTARVTPKQNGEYINISVNAKAAQRMNLNDLAAMLNNEVMSMSNVNMNTNVMVTDNSQKIDGKWVEGAVANVMDKGYAY